MWNNPKSAVALLVLKDGRFLAAKRGIEPRKGSYDLPGGFVNYNEQPADAVKREMREEAGIEILNPVLIAAYTAEYIPNVSATDLIFVVTQWEGTLEAQDDVAALEWKPLDFMDGQEFCMDYPGIKEIAKRLMP